MSFRVSFCSLVFFSPFSIAITSLWKERANIGAFRTFVRVVVIWICRFPLPLVVWEGLQFVIVALPFLLPFFFLPESQCGFRKNNGTIYMNFTARELQEKCQEQNVDLYMTFVDLTKAFDTVSRKDLWKIMATFGCPAKFIAMVRQFNDGMFARVKMMASFLIHSL